jgi:hypothetical protein
MENEIRLLTEQVSFLRQDLIPAIDRLTEQVKRIADLYEARPENEH